MTQSNRMVNTTANQTVDGDNPTKNRLPYDNLAQCIQQLRLSRRWSLSELSQKTAIEPELLTDIEEGRQVFLPTAHRIRLASVLRVSASQIAAFEQPDLGQDNAEHLTDSERLSLARQTHRCPDCQSPLRITTYDRQDMHGQSFVATQYTCTQCLYRQRFESIPSSDGELF